MPNITATRPEVGGTVASQRKPMTALKIITEVTDRGSSICLLDSSTARTIAGSTIPNEVPAIPAPTSNPAEPCNAHLLSTPAIISIPRANRNVPPTTTLVFPNRSARPPANTAIIPHDKFWMARAMEITSRPQLLYSEMGVTNKPKLDRNPNDRRRSEHAGMMRKMLDLFSFITLLSNPSPKYGEGFERRVRQNYFFRWRLRTVLRAYQISLPICFSGSEPWRFPRKGWPAPSSVRRREPRNFRLKPLP